MYEYPDGWRLNVTKKVCPVCGEATKFKDTMGVPKLVVCKQCGFKFFQWRGV